MKTLRENFVEIVLLLSIVLWLIAIGITPVGGWCKSNPHHEHYKTAFVATTLMLYGAIALMFIRNYRKRNK